MQERRDFVLSELVASLNSRGLPAQRYTIAGFTGFAALGIEETTVEHIEAYLGPSPGKPGYKSYAVAQTFLSRYPSLALTFLVELRDSDRSINPSPAKFGIEVDKKFSTVFLPIMHTALNSLDPSGRNRGLLVQSYNSEMTLFDFVQASYYSTALLVRFKRDGQLALIAVDYYDRLTRLIAGALRSLGRIVPDIHLIPRTKTVSALQLPIPDGAGGFRPFSGHSTALDEGFRLAFAYFDKHYQNHDKHLK